ncbi:hypothetical protein PV08_08095 [Exophiala spinifera]|uniref:NmrA-like domain-containing protein n=1 Tax=Exophiala spinifera TaxID=91928 RepID=A0A0D2B1X4_9EURO|nr:uncharacterized protein PV08_08095 [Exophiala spinifera]KIW12908.1 hypothetical protein PV08_08095 [Exophiala spinifera]
MSSTSSSKRIAVAGVGSLGLPVVLALLEAGHAVTILTRSASTKKEGIPAGANVEYAAVDYTSVESLKKALEGHYGVVSTLTTTSVGAQAPLIEASVQAGVSRFIPSEFGSDTTNPKAKALPVYGAKIATQEKIEEVAAKNPGWSYTAVINGAFFDWGVKFGFLGVDLKKHTATLYNGGDRRFSTTTLAGVAKAVVGIFSHPEETKNREIRVHETVITQKKIIDIAKRLDPAEWTYKAADTEELKNQSFEVLKSGKVEEIPGAMINFLASAIWGEGYGSEFVETENDLLGVPLLDEAEVEKVIAQYI